MSGEGDEDGDKSFEPTQRKLDEARKRGEIPRSTDVIAASAYGGLLLTTAVFAPASIATIGTALTVLLDQPDRLAPLVLGDGGLEGGAQGVDPRPQHIGEPDEERRLDLALHEVVHQGPQVQGLAARGHGHVARLEHVEQVQAPAADVVELAGVVQGPASAQFSLPAARRR